MRQNAGCERTRTDEEKREGAPEKERINGRHRAGGEERKAHPEKKDGIEPPRLPPYIRKHGAAEELFLKHGGYNRHYYKSEHHPAAGEVGKVVLRTFVAAQPQEFFEPDVEPA